MTRTQHDDGGPAAQVSAQEAAAAPAKETPAPDRFTVRLTHRPDDEIEVSAAELAHLRNEHLVLGEPKPVTTKPATSGATARQ